MSKYGYVGSDSATPTQTNNSNAGVFSVNDIIDLKNANKFSLPGAFKLIQRQSFTNVSAVEFTDLKEDVYDMHVLMMHGVYGGNDITYGLTVSTDGGSSYRSTGYQYTYSRIEGDSSANTINEYRSTNTTYMAMNRNVSAVNTNMPIDGIIKIHDIGNSDKYTTAIWDAVHTDSSLNSELTYGGGSYPTAEAHNAIKFFPNTETITGTLELYGWSK